MVWRYSSSATVACSCDMGAIVPVPAGRVPPVQITPGTRAFVTGASRGIGAALSRALADRGAVVGLAARSTGESAALAAQLPGAHHVIACDVADTESVREAIATFADLAGGIDLLVVNAGHHALRPVPPPVARGPAADERGQLARHAAHRPLRPAAPARPRERACRRRLLRRGAALVPVGRRLRRDEGRAADVRRGAAPRAERHRRLADDRLPGRDRDEPARPREGPHAGLVPRRARRGERGRPRRGA